MDNLKHTNAEFIACNRSSAWMFPNNIFSRVSLSVLDARITVFAFGSQFRSRLANTWAMLLMLVVKILAAEKCRNRTARLKRLLWADSTSPSLMLWWALFLRICMQTAAICELLGDGRWPNVWSIADVIEDPHKRWFENIWKIVIEAFVLSTEYALDSVWQWMCRRDLECWKHVDATRITSFVDECQWQAGSATLTYIAGRTNVHKSHKDCIWVFACAKQIHIVAMLMCSFKLVQRLLQQEYGHNPYWPTWLLIHRLLKFNSRLRPPDRHSKSEVRDMQCGTRLLTSTFRCMWRGSVGSLYPSCILILRKHLYHCQWISLAKVCTVCRKTSAESRQISIADLFDHKGLPEDFLLDKLHFCTPLALGI